MADTSDSPLSKRIVSPFRFACFLKEQEARFISHEKMGDEGLLSVRPHRGAEECSLKARGLAEKNALL